MWQEFSVKCQCQKWIKFQNEPLPLCVDFGDDFLSFFFLSVSETIPLDGSEFKFKGLTWKAFRCVVMSSLNNGAKYIHNYHMLLLSYTGDRNIYIVAFYCRSSRAANPQNRCTLGMSFSVRLNESNVVRVNPVVRHHPAARRCRDAHQWRLRMSERWPIRGWVGGHLSNYGKGRCRELCRC